MEKCTEGIVRIERGSRVMIYLEFPAVYKETPDGVKETWQGSKETQNELNSLSNLQHRVS